MSDLATRYEGFLVGADLALDEVGFAVDGGLSTAIILSLFTDRRADPEELEPGQTDPRGWWGDIVPLAEGYRLGSKLWLLQRQKQLPLVLERARAYAAEALAWLVESGAASWVQVDATNPRPGILALQVTVDGPLSGSYQYQWEWMRDAL